MRQDTNVFTCFEYIYFLLDYISIQSYITNVICTFEKIIINICLLLNEKDGNIFFVAEAN